MKTPIYTYLIIFCLASFFSFAQTTINGKVTDSIGKPIAYANVILQTKQQKNIISFTSTKQDGSFSLETEEEGEYLLAFTSLGYTKKEVEITLPSANPLQLEVSLNEEQMQLDEVIITSENPIQTKKDSVIFDADSFKRGDEVVVEDLLKNLPGVNVESDGTIKVGDREIERLMVDGDDLFEKGYKVLSKNMTSDAVDKIEIYDKYSLNKLLKGIEESDRVAMNIQLKEDYKQEWFGNADLGAGGFDQLYHRNRVNLMSFGKKSKYYFLGNTNNIGIDAIGDVSQMIRPLRYDQPGSVGDGESAKSLLGLSTDVPQLKRERTNFNDAKLASINAIHNLNDQMKIRTVGFFNWDNQDFFRNSTTDFLLDDQNFTNTEDFSMNKRKFIGFGKIDYTYDIADNKMLEYTGAVNFSDNSTLSNLVFNSNSTIESLEEDNQLIDQKVLYTHKLNEQKVFLLSGRYLNEESPQAYVNNQFLFGDLFENAEDTESVGQLSKNKMQFFGVEAEYKNRKKSKDLFEAVLGATHREDRLNSTFQLFDQDNNTTEPNGFQNLTQYQVTDIYAKGKYLYKAKQNLNLSLNLDGHQLINRLNQLEGQTQNQDFFYLQPKLNMRWELNPKNTFIANYIYSTNNASIIDLYQNNILTSFRGFNRGIDQPTQLNASSYMLMYRLGNFGDRFFANFSANYIQNHDFFSSQSFIQQDFQVNEKILIQDQELLNLNAQIDRYFKAISSNVKLKLNYSETNFINFVNQSGAREVDNKMYNFGIEMRSGFLGGFNYHIGTEFRVSQVEVTQDGFSNSFSNTDNFSFLDLTYVFSEQFNVSLNTELYYFGNIESGNRDYYFSDFNARYITKSKNITYGLSFRNLFNTQTFRNFSISDINTTTTSYRLLPRILLIHVDFRF